MNTLLIVEDNDFERNALQHYVDWDLLGVRVVDTAHNGKDGLEKARLHQPDIIISDVKMPVMDGIEMAKAIAHFNPNIKFIFSSGHDDAETLKEALEVRAYSYLIKPVRQEELIAVLRRIASVSMDEKLSHRASRKIMEQFHHNLPHLQTKFLEELMNGLHSPDEANLIYTRANDLELQMTGSYKLALIEFDYAANTDIFQKSRYLGSILTELQDACDSKDVLFIKDGDSRIIAVLHSLKEDSDKDKQLLHTVGNKIALLMEVQPFRYVIGVSTGAPNLTDLGMLYRQCCSTINGKVGFGYGSVITFEQAYARTSALSDPDTGLMKQIIDEIVSGACGGKDCEESIQKLMHLMTTEHDMKLERIQSIMISLFSSLSKSMANIGEKIDMVAKDESELFHGVVTAKTLPDIVHYVRQVMNEVSSYMGRKNLNKEDYMIQEILNILNKDFCKSITLSYISDRVFLSPNYLRVLFKDKMNISIQDYLTQLRINKAKELLRQNRYKVHEIGEMVGYENSTYFNLVFKNSVHMTPKEYRNKYMTQVSGA
ncbi:response regulator [Paenibacillus sepulcri]|uniref:Response regulator n=1 Tax=Paenibacillus sepulcri TaxID=359917 RepID=A0ABS7BW99_9BACL|nr:response regulator [Paenibacillus sepulcri]